MRRVGVLAVAGLFALTACGTVTVESKPVARQGSAVELKVADVADLGPIVTDAEGFTLYRFDGDTAGVSTCDGECAAAWPPAVSSGDVAVDGVARELVGTILRKDGSRQLTIAGLPQYRFAKDGKPGETKGQGLQGKWFATGVGGERANLAARTGVVTGLGAVLTNAAGLTLYRFDGDRAQPSESTCDGGCAGVWPPVYVEGSKPRVKGVESKLLGVVVRKDGRRQLTVAGWPQYTYSKDVRPGEAKGQGVGGKWFATKVDGGRAGR